MQKIVFVAHCVLNTASKVVMDESEDMLIESMARKNFLLKMIEKDVQIVQLPCPEFTAYGSNRWGHVSNQFDNVFFKNHCEKLLHNPICEIQEYMQNYEKFKVIGIVGIDGSPSCGVSLTCTSSEWGGSKADSSEWAKKVDTCKTESKSGVFINVLKELLKQKTISVNLTSITDPELYLKLGVE